ncbi:MAG: biotin--[acetyl-CoA-carboxylase] ligase [Candidatus Nanopelagicales bacterium]
MSRACEALGWPELRVVERTGSTNDDLIGGGSHGQVLLALEQTAGRGRLDRTWVSAPGDGLTFSVRLEVPATVRAWGWIPLLAGVAVADAVRATGAQSVGVKWPNDVVAGDGKLAGILSIRDGSAAVVGIGINLAFAGDLPDPQAVSVEQAGGVVDADFPAGGRCGESGLRGGSGSSTPAAMPNAAACRRPMPSQCVSVGVDVTVAAPDRTWSGFAEGIDHDGRLLVRDGEVRAVSAGDVTLRRSR